MPNEKPTRDRAHEEKAPAIPDLDPPARTKDIAEQVKGGATLSCTKGTHIPEVN